ncbi:NINE protein, partial [Saccharomonospora xinjiangensis]|uniref:NINE protein n=1 Tax=Saccharomonospora xinjiangensis TaxID=75294 RepID=UPI00350F4611
PGGPARRPRAPARGPPGARRPLRGRTSHNLRVRGAHRPVLTARTRGDVRPLFADLPEPHPAFLTAATPAVVAPAPTPAADLTTPEPSDRSAVTAGVLQIVLPFGAGRFYTGETRLAVLQLLCVVITFGMGALWPLIDGIVLLTQGGTDGRGRTLR